jgi:hypothetical protein
MLCFRLAEVLHKSVAEIQMLDWDELSGWVAYFKLKQQDQDQ